MSGILEAFLLGATATASAVIALFFVRFWKSTRDLLFLSFAAWFTIEAALRVVRVVLWNAGRPNDGTPGMYWIRLVAALLILAAILRKNYPKERKKR